MSKYPVLEAVKQLKRPVFTTREVAMLSEGSLSNTTHGLNNLVKKGIVLKMARGLWALDIQYSK
ncbi:type IV toxin-antitoxin system AbiEi family antitoxin domain-containing protein [Candidatus Poribacteria bacterium]|nr:type IV toxin-antitoxin system AbiEi family antitoxin domain-containing protein [Candidatus Poribacteria bacterium]